MHTPSIHTLADLAYERGEEFDPALMLSPSLAESLKSISTAVVVPAGEEVVPAGVEMAGAEEMSTLTQS